jgi:hypothetical protein
VAVLTALPGEYVYVRPHIICMYEYILHTYIHFYYRERYARVLCECATLRDVTALRASQLPDFCWTNVKPTNGPLQYACLTLTGRAAEQPPIPAALLLPVFTYISVRLSTPSILLSCHPYTLNLLALNITVNCTLSSVVSFASISISVTLRQDK